MKKLKLHLCCGKRNFGKDWIHIDGGNYDHLDFNDVTKLQFDDNSVDLIYCSHGFQYFDRYDEVPKLLAEWYRVLKVGGILRLAVPDFYTVTRLYLEHGYKLDKFYGLIFGKMKMNDKFIYNKAVYDYVEIKDVLLDAKFKTVRRYSWKDTCHAQFDDHSKAYFPHNQEAIETQSFEGLTLVSLNVEAIK